MNVSRNRFSTFRPPKGEPVITFSNASTVSFRDNDVTSYAGGASIPVAVKFETKDVVRKPRVPGWDVVGNRFRGNAKLPPDFNAAGTGSFTTCVKMAIGHDTVGEVRVAENMFSGCRTQVMLEAEKESADGLAPAGAFVRAPHVTGNIGDGTALVLQGVPAVLVGGSLAQEGTLPAGARYCGPAKPDFAAPVGSLYSRTGGGALERLWINIDGGIVWKPLVVGP